eukprot:gene2697-3118_t
MVWACQQNLQKEVESLPLAGVPDDFKEIETDYKIDNFERDTDIPDDEKVYDRHTEVSSFFITLQKQLRQVDAIDMQLSNILVQGIPFQTNSGSVNCRFNFPRPLSRLHSEALPPEKSGGERKKKSCTPGFLAENSLVFFVAGKKNSEQERVAWRQSRFVNFN